jgi:hypothetical protein
MPVKRTEIALTLGRSNELRIDRVADGTLRVSHGAETWVVPHDADVTVYLAPTPSEPVVPKSPAVNEILLDNADPWEGTDAEAPPD